MTGSGQASIAIAKRYFTAVNESRLDDLAAAFAEDAILSFPMLPPVAGRKAIQEFYAGVLVFYPERRDDITRWFVSEGGGDVAAEISFVGKTSTGKTVEFDAVDVFTIRNGVIQKLIIYYDSAKVLQMLGELPK
jgi:ketosteroid isomerase-like protein